MLNTEKTLGPRPNSETLVFEISDGEQRYTMEYANEDGKKGRTDWAVKCDGQDHPSGPGSTNRTVSLTRLGAKTELSDSQAGRLRDRDLYAGAGRRRQHAHFNRSRFGWQDRVGARFRKAIANRLAPKGETG